MVKNVFKKLGKKQKNNKGFSLVELIVVIAIMAVLVGVLAPQLIKYVEKSREATDIQNCDSIASALALETILESMGKSVSLYCGVETPGYLKYIDGWSRVSDSLPNEFDVSIIVDTSSSILLGKLSDNIQYSKIKNNPVIIIDHHQNVKCDINYADIVLNDYKLFHYVN